MNQRTARIVVGYDGSPSSAQALRWGVDQSLLEHRGLTVAHAVADPGSVWAGAMVPPPLHDRAELEAMGRGVLAQARRHVRDHAPELDPTEHLEIGDPREMLIRLSAESSLVVLGSRGRGPLRSLLLGSVGTALARHPRCPVVIHRPQRTGTVRCGVLVAVDTTSASRPVLEAAFELASSRRLPLTVLHCHVESSTASLAGYAPTPADLELDRVDVAQAVSGLGEKFPDVAVERTLVLGPPEPEVCARSRRADVLVVGASSSTGAARLLGSLSIGLVEHAECPVMVVPVTRAEKDR